MRLKAVLLALALASSVQAQTLLNATPSVRVDSDQKSTQRTVLTAVDREKARITIVRLDGKYYWATREHRELAYARGGAMHFFTSPDGGGYVKVMDTHFLSASLRAPGPRFRFMEHVTLGMGSITYFGATDSFAVDHE